MSLVKKTFVLNENIVFECYILIILDIHNVMQFWFKGIDITKFLEYKNPQKAIFNNVHSDWRKTYTQLGCISATPLDNGIKVPSNWQPHTIFILEAGLYALICRSKKIGAINFQKWLYEVVLPSLRRTGLYDMNQLGGPSMSQQVSVWEKEKVELIEKNNKLQIDLLTSQLKLQTEMSKLKETCDTQISLLRERLTTKISRLQEQAIEYERELGILRNACTMLRCHANNSVIEMAKNGLLAQHNIVENDTFRENLKKLVDRVVPKSEPLKEHYNVCYMYTKKSVTHYKLIRSQLVTIQKYERQMSGQLAPSPAKRARLSDNWLSTAVEIFRLKSPNPISFWNSVRQRFPEKFYGVRFANGTANTDIVYLTEEEVRLCYRKDLEIENTIRRQGKGKVQTTFVSKFGKFAFIDEDDAVRRCFTAEENTRKQTVSMLEIFREEMQDEIIPQTDAVRDASGFTTINIVNYIQDNITNVTNKDNCIVEINFSTPSSQQANNLNKDCT